MGSLVGMDSQDEWRSNGHRRRKAYKLVLGTDPKRRPNCALCGQPGADSVDHIKSQRDRPDLVWDPGNWQPAHTDCNTRKGAAPQQYTLGPQSRQW